MPRNYSVNGNNATGKTTTATTMIQLHGAALCRTWVYDITLGSPIAPQDYAQTYDLVRYTVVGTVTAFTPLILDPVNIASLAVPNTNATGINASLEPTYPNTTALTSSLLVVPLNSRATFRYVASPGAEFVNTASSGNGLGLRQSATTAIQGNATLIWFE